MSVTVIEPVVQNPAPEPQTPETPPAQTADEKRFNQAELNKFLNDEKDKWKRQQEQAEAKAVQGAREKALLENQEFKTLAEQRGARVAELEAETGTIETLTGERDAALAVVADLVKDELKHAPDYVAEAIADRNAVDQLRYIQKNREKWSTPPLRSIPASGNGRNTPQSMEDRIAADELALRASGRYSV